MSRRLQGVSLVAACTRAALAGCIAISLHAQSPAGEADQVRDDLRALKSYGVFDLITFQVNPDASITLAGYVTSSALKKDAQHALESDKSLHATVVNKIEVAPISTTDQNLRQEAFTAIYRDKFLAKYGTPADQAAAERGRAVSWGSGYAGFGEMRGPRWTGAPFYGQEPIGSYAIHILVKKGVVTLAGVVESQQDKEQATQDAQRIGNLHTLNNDLHVKGNAVQK